MSRAYRIQVTIETYDDVKDLNNEEAEPVRELTGYAVTRDYTMALRILGEALAKFTEDPLNSSDWWG